MTTTRHWAKAPAQSDPAQVQAIRVATEGDKKRYTSAGLQPVQCRACSTCVLVKKNSDIHTSIQWTSETGTCHRLNEPGKNGRPSALRDSCPDLSASIVQAVREGLIHVAPHSEDTVDE